MEDIEPKDLTVRRATSQEEIRDFIIRYCQRLEWMPGKMDSVLYWVAGPEGAGVYVGELRGRRITGVTMIQHSDSYGYVSSYYCEKRYRGKGYGFKTWKVARAALNPHLNLALDTIVSPESSKASMYETQGFKKAWVSPILFFHVTSILEAFEKVLIPKGVTIEQAAEVDFAKVKLYIEDVMGITFTHSSLLEKWISLPTHKAFVALKDENIVGVITIRKSLPASNGYRVSPLLANSGDIARLLLDKAAKEVHINEAFSLFVACEINAEAKQIVSEIKDPEHTVDLVRMYTNGEPPLMKKDKGHILNTFGIGGNSVVANDLKSRGRHVICLRTGKSRPVDPPTKVIRKEQGAVIMDASMEVVDGHIHMWTAATHPWLDSVKDGGSPIGKFESVLNYLLDDYRADTSGYNVTHCVHIEALWTGDPVDETKWVNDIADKNAGGFPQALVGYCDLSSANADEVLKQHSQFKRTRGIRQILSYDPDHTAHSLSKHDLLTDKNWMEGFGLLEKYNMSFDMLILPTQMKRAADVIKQHPGVMVVVEHCGLPYFRDEPSMKVWKEGLQELAKYPNVYIKASGMFSTDPKWDQKSIDTVVKPLFDIFGFDRTMFASDFPVTKINGSWRQMMDSLKVVLQPYSEEEHTKFFSKNAKRFYRL